MRLRVSHPHSTKASTTHREAAGSASVSASADSDDDAVEEGAAAQSARRCRSIGLAATLLRWLRPGSRSGASSSEVRAPGAPSSKREAASVALSALPGVPQNQPDLALARGAVDIHSHFNS
jgi:hypothetical protein